MKLIIASYNVEWMVSYFSKEGEPKTDGEHGERSRLLAEVVRTMDTTVWNPYLDHKPQANEGQDNAIRTELKAASDHFPVSVELEL